MFHSHALIHMLHSIINFYCPYLYGHADFQLLKFYINTVRKRLEGKATFSWLKFHQQQIPGAARWARTPLLQKKFCTLKLDVCDGYMKTYRGRVFFSSFYFLLLVF